MASGRLMGYWPISGCPVCVLYNIGEVGKLFKLLSSHSLGDSSYLYFPTIKYMSI